MKPTLTLTLLTFLLLAPLAALHAADGPKWKPNVLLIVADDQGYADFGFMGNRLVKTPQIDRLAGESAVFRNFVVAAVCSPTRTALWTGRDHLLAGVWGVPPKANLRDDEVRMPAFFKAAVSDTVQKHLPFTGVSLRPALNDAGKTFERRAALRADIAGVGAPKNGPGGRKLENVHLALRGPRFKYHVLPGGKAALFDLDADPGETADVQAKFPKVAAKMAAECRQRWDEILASGRAFAPQPSLAPAARKKPPSSSGD